MKFSTRLKLASITAIMVMMLTGSAWGADTYGVRAEPTLTDAGTGLTVKFTFYKNGKQVNLFTDFGDVATEDLDIAKEYALPKISIKTADGDELYSDASIPNWTMDDSGVITAKYMLKNRQIAEESKHDTEIKVMTDPLTAGYYLIQYHSLWGTNPTNDVKVNALGEKYEEVGTEIDNYENIYADHEGVPGNGGQLVAIGIKTETKEDVEAVIESDADLEAVTENGKASVEKLAESGLDSGTIVGLDVFKATGLKGDSSDTLITSYTAENLDDIAAKGYKVKDLVVVKLTRDNGNVEFKRVEPGTLVSGGQFTVSTFGGTLSAEDAIQPDTAYIFSFGIKDDSIHDWDNTPGTIVDPLGYGARSQGSGGGSGGCNAGGYGMIALMLAGFGLVTRKSR